MRLSLPVAILLGSVIVALALSFGMDKAPREPPPVNAPGPVHAQGSAPRVVTPPSQPITPPAPTEAQTAATVTNLVVRVHPSWKAACWDSADPATRKPGRYAATLSFDATGKLVIFGIKEIRGESDPTVAQCLRKQELAFSVPAPGRSLSFDVPFQVP